MNNISQTNWKTSDERFVAFLDILGFKDMIMRFEHDHIYKTLNSLSSLRNTIEQWGAPADDISSESLIYTASFSDSIIIFSKNNDFDTFKIFTSNVAYLFSKAIESGIALKGAIAYGQISINKSNQIYFGQPIIDAYLLEEEVNYLGLVAHNSIDRYLSSNSPGQNRTLFETETPLKAGNIVHTNINWFRHVNGLENAEEAEFNYIKIKQIINNLKLNMSGSPRKYIDNTLQILDKVKTTYPNYLTIPNTNQHGNQISNAVQTIRSTLG